MYAAALVMGDIFDAGYFDPEKQFALFLDINHLGFGEMGPSGVNASSSMTVKFHTKNMDHMVMLHSVYTAKTQEETEALTAEACAIPAIGDKFNHMLLIRARRHADEDLGRSTPVRITGLINRPELNGRVAKMIGPKPGDPQPSDGRVALARQYGARSQVRQHRAHPSRRRHRSLRTTPGSVVGGFTSATIENTNGCGTRITSTSTHGNDAKLFAFRSDMTWTPLGPAFSSAYGSACPMRGAVFL
eukprot:CAMPEP_0181388974 /NCGR_PEP_ID=MMETSP1106-20121128/24627_1 /TAXON_ID=81844 /ORGANISM="Mantoniella antarctica, Strain SL-175" /LENGTH=244 /DNA_ID=CAMNT_0023509633 /DNA_START=27 /DNA_END=757 /DNA_ORIENTATION=-